MPVSYVTRSLMIGRFLKLDMLEQRYVRTVTSERCLLARGVQATGHNYRIRRRGAVRLPRELGTFANWTV